MTLLFTERLRRRQLCFWSHVPLSLHQRWWCAFPFLEPTVPPARWRCCALWPRKLVNKWNARLFAEQRQCFPARLLWHGGDPASIPFDDLPESYVVRGAFGTRTKATFVIHRGRNLIDGQPCARRALVKRLKAIPYLRRRRLLVEEWLPPPDGRVALPMEYRFYCFASEVALIEVIERKPEQRTETSYFDPAWQRWREPLLDLREPHDEDLPPPLDLTPMLAAARRLGEDAGTFLRIDFLTSTDGPRFLEFSTCPHWTQPHRPGHDHRMGELWRSILGDNCI